VLASKTMTAMLQCPTFKDESCPDGSNSSVGKTS